MGAFLGLLSGIAKGAGEQYSQIEKEKRDNTFRQNELLADTLDKRVANDPTLSVEDREGLHRQSMKLRGVPDAMVDKILDASGYHQLKTMGGGGGGGGGGAAPAGGSQTQSAPAGFPQLPQAPGQNAQAQPPGGRPSLPPIPDFNGAYGAAGTYQGKVLDTQLAEQAASQRVAQTAEEARRTRKAQIDEEQQRLKDEINFLQTNQGARHLSVDVGASGLKSAKAEPGRFSGYVSGADIEDENEHLGGRPIDPNKYYRRLEFANPDQEGGTSEYAVANNIGTHSVVPDPKSPTGFSTQFFGKDGRPQFLQPGATPPSAFVQKTSSAQTSSSANPNAQGGTDTSRSVTRTTGPGAITVPGSDNVVIGQPPPTKATPATPIPKSSGSGINRVGKPFDPTNPVDFAAGLMATDANAAKDLQNKMNKTAITNRAAELHITPNIIPAAIRDAATYAQTLQSHVQEIQTSLKSPEVQQALGVAASRWNDFIANKVGAGDPAYVKLHTAVDLLASGLLKVHGIRGGYALQHFEDLMATGKMNAQTLKAAVDEVGEWVDRYAAMAPKAQPVNPTSAIPTNPDTAAAKKRLIDAVKGLQ